MMNQFECQCPCHTTNGLHIRACCAGQCPNCKKYIKFDFWDSHQKECKDDLSPTSQNVGQMNLYVYETESVAFEGGCVEIVIITAENREVADEAMLKDPMCWVSDQAHLNNVYKVEEKLLFPGGVMFRGKVLERLDPHTYEH